MPDTTICEHEPNVARFLNRAKDSRKAMPGEIRRELLPAAPCLQSWPAEDI